MMMTLRSEPYNREMSTIVTRQVRDLEPLHRVDGQFLAVFQLLPKPSRLKKRCIRIPILQATRHLEPVRADHSNLALLDTELEETVYVANHNVHLLLVAVRALLGELFFTAV